MTGEAAALASAAFWALSTVSVKGVTGRLSASYIMAVRTAMAAVVALVFILVIRPGDVNLSLPALTLAALLGSALLPMVGDVAFVRAISVEELSRVFTVSTSVYILLSVVGSVLFFSEPFSWLLVVGGAAVLTGSRLVLTETRPDAGAARFSERQRQPLLGLQLSLFAALFWSAGLLSVSEVLESVEALTATLLRLIFMAATLLLFVGLKRELRIADRPAKDFQTLGVSSVLTLGSMLLFILSAKLASAGTVAVLTSTSPIFAVPLAHFLLKERVTPRIIAGTVICMGGIWLTLA